MVEKKGEKIMTKVMEEQIQKSFKRFLRNCYEEMSDLIKCFEEKEMNKNTLRQLNNDIKNFEKKKEKIEQLKELESMNLLSKKDLSNLGLIVTHLERKCSATKNEKNKEEIKRLSKKQEEVEDLIWEKRDVVLGYIKKIDETIEEFKKYNLDYKGDEDRKLIGILSLIYASERNLEGQNHRDKIKFLFRNFFHEDEKNEELIATLERYEEELGKALAIYTHPLDIDRERRVTRHPIFFRLENDGMYPEDTKKIHICENIRWLYKTPE